MRATPPPFSSGRHGSTANVVGSGIAIMSDSSIALKPVIEEPSKPIPPSNASSSSSALIENDFSWPRMSVNQSRMKRMPRSSTRALTSSAVCGLSASVATAGRLAQPPRSDRRSRRQSNQRSAQRLSSLEGRRELAAALGQLVVDADGAGAGHVPLDDPARLELLHALGEQAVGELGHRVRDLGEAQRTRRSSSTERIAPVQRLPTSSTASWKCGQQWHSPGRSSVATLVRGADGDMAYQAARNTRVSSTEPSTGTSPATLTIAVKHSSATTAIASSSCSSVQPASRASSWRCCGTAAALRHERA